MFWPKTAIKKGLGAILTASMLPRSTATGTMTVRTNCNYPVWMQVVHQGGGNPKWQLLDNKDPFSYPLSAYPPLGPNEDDGVAIKLGLQDYTGLSPGPITIVEVTWDPDTQQVAYDASDLNAYGPSPFYEQGYYMWPDMGNSTQFPLCIPVHCPRGVNPCYDAYWYSKYKNPLSHLK